MREITAALISSLFDPSPVRFRESDEAGVAPVRRACSSVRKEPYVLRKALNRNALLCGCLDFTEHEGVEHLIVGMGRRLGATTKISKIMYVRGTERAVALPTGFDESLVTWLGSSHDAEVVVFHNHPANYLNVIFDNVPVASTPDRNTLVGYYLRPVLFLKGLFRGGRARFFVGENGFVREFRTPDLLSAFSRR